MNPARPKGLPATSKKLFSFGWIAVLAAVFVLFGPGHARADVSGTITPGGSSVTFSLGSGEVGRFTFSGTQGQRIAVKASGVSVSPGYSYETIALVKPDGTTLPGSQIVGLNGGFLDPQTLPVSGTYTVRVTPASGTTSTTTLTAYDVPADVTGSIATDGTAVTATTTTPGQNAVLSFSGAAGQRVYLKASGSTFSPYAAIVLRNPSGGTIATGYSASIDTQTLSTTGTYSILVDPNAAATGTITLRLYDVPPDSVTPVSVIQTTGTPTDFSFPTPGRTNRFTFAGAAGQRVSIKVIGSTVGYGDFKLLKPDGTQQTSTWFSTGDRTMDTQTLATSGTYTVVLDPQGDYTGTGRLAVYEVPQDITQAVTFGTAVSLNASAPGMRLHLTFAGTAGHRVTVQLASSTISWGTMRLRKPDGTEITNTWFSTGARFLDLQTLPVDGTYTVDLEPDTGKTGTVTATVWDVPADFAASVTPSNAGAATPISLATPGQNAEVTFAGQAGMRLFTKLAGSTFSWGTLSLIGPTGSTVASTWFSTGDQRIDTLALPADGTYRVRVDPDREYIGAATLTLYEVPPDVSAPVDFANPADVQLPVPGMKARLTFNGAAGQRVLLSTTGSTITWGSTKILKPDGTELASTYLTTGDQYIDTQTLPVDGTYTVLIQPDAAYTGSVAVRVYDVPPDASGTIDVDGAAAHVDLAVGQNATLTFNGIGGEQLQLSYPNGFGNNFGALVVKKPDGSELARTGLYQGSTISMPVLPTSGTYSVLVDPRGIGAGSIDLGLHSLGLAAKPISPDGDAVTAEVVRAGGSQKLTFSGIQGQRMSVTADATTLEGTISLLAPDGSSLAQDALALGSDSMLDATTLPATGSYTILVQAAAGKTGTTSVRLHDVSTDVFGSLTAGADPVTVSIAKPGQNAILSFSADPGTVQRLSLGGSTIAGGTLSVRNAAGETIASCPFAAGSQILDTAALQAGGNYTLLIDPRRANTGSVNVSLRSRDATAPGSISPGGAPVSAGWTDAHDDAGLVFDGTAGDNVSLVLSDYSMASGTLQILRPDGSELASWPIVGGTAFIDTKALPMSGTYSVRAAQRSAGAGRGTFALYNVPQRPAAQIAIGGDSVQVDAGVPGENPRVSFTAEAGTTISLRSTQSTISFASLKLYGPNGGLVANSWTTDSGFMDATKLDADGQYELVVDPSGPATGSARLRLYEVPTPDPSAIPFSGSDESVSDPNGTVDPNVDDEDDGNNGPDDFPGAQQIAISTPGENAGYTFDGVAGQRISALALGSTLPLSSIRLIAPDGTQVANSAAGVGKGFLDATTLPETGTYRLLFDPSGSDTGSASLTAFDVPSDITTDLPFDTPVSFDLTTPGQKASLPFQAEAGQQINVTVSSTDIPYASVRVQKTDGTTLDSNVLIGDNGEATIETTIDTTGDFRVVVDPWDSGTGTAQVWLSDSSTAGDPQDPDPPPDELDPTVQDAPDEGATCPADLVQCGDTLTKVVSPPPDGARELQSSSADRPKCSIFEFGGFLTRKYTGRFGWYGKTCYGIEARTQEGELVGTAAMLIEYRVSFSGTTPKISARAKLTNVAGVGTEAVSVIFGAICFPWISNPGPCPLGTAPLPVASYPHPVSVLRWWSLGSVTLPAFAADSDPAFNFFWLGSTLVGDPEHPLPVFDMATNKFRCETMPAAKTKCVFPGYTPRITFSRSDPHMKHVARHMYFAINELNKPTTLHKNAAIATANRRAAQCTPGGPWEPKLPNWSCDEYPFASTNEGGAGASIRGVPLAENKAQGSKLGGFYRFFHVLDGEKFYVKVK